MISNTAINSDVQKRRFALLLHAGYGERSAQFELIGRLRHFVATPKLPSKYLAVCR